MIASLSLQNFQSHQNTYLKFSPGVNVIIGSSDSGKTSLLRAMAWVITNRPGGEAFRSHWGGDTVVTIELDEGTIVKRSRTNNNENTYTLNEIIFRAFGQSVPEEISHILNIGETNLQRQLDAPYLLADSPGEVARQLNTVAHLDDIDRANTGITFLIRTTDNSLLNKNDQIENLSKKIDKLAWLDTAETKLNSLEVLIVKINQITDRINNLSKLTQSIELWQHKLDGMPNIDAALAAMHSLHKLGRKLSKLKTKILHLDKLIQLIYQTNEEIRAERHREQNLQAKHRKLMPDNVCPLCGRKINGQTKR